MINIAYVIRLRKNRILYTYSVRRTYQTLYRRGGRIRLASVGLAQARPNKKLEGIASGFIDINPLHCLLASAPLSHSRLATLARLFWQAFSRALYRIAGFFEGEYLHEFRGLATIRENILRELFSYRHVTY